MKQIIGRWLLYLGIMVVTFYASHSLLHLSYAQTFVALVTGTCASLIGNWASTYMKSNKK